jgi:hypothetical protein
MATQWFLQINNFKDVELEGLRFINTPRQRFIMHQRGGSRQPEILPGGYDQTYGDIEVEFRTRPDLYAFLASSEGLKEFRVTIKEREVVARPRQSRLSKVGSFLCTLQKVVLPSRTPAQQMPLLKLTLVKK